jgi:uncharacterized RDD family membrane protein YckC
MTQPPYQPHPQAPYYPPPPPHYAEMQYYQQGPHSSPPELVPADWSARATASLLDSAFFVVVLIFCSVVRAMLDPSDGDASIIALAVVVLLALVWNRVYLQCTSGQSVGKRVLRIQLLSEETLLPPGVARTLGRELLGFVLSRIPLLGLVWGLSPLFDDRRRAWHDAALSTIVVKRPRY